MMHGGYGFARQNGISPTYKHRPAPGILCMTYQCHSMACLNRPGLEFGDKIIMPQAAFKEAHRLRLRLPLLFKAVNHESMDMVGPPLCQFCGVLEFSAPDDQVYLPYWMMQNLLLSEGGWVKLCSIIRPPVGSFVRFRSHDERFFGVASHQGPKALMEGALRHYSILAEGTTILIQHEGDNFYLDVVEIRALVLPLRTANRNNEGLPEPGSGGRGCYGDDGGEKGSANSWTGGRRVPLVSLLGDLDLEVEFCSTEPTDTEHQRGDLHPERHLRRGSQREASTECVSDSRSSAAQPTEFLSFNSVTADQGLGGGVSEENLVPLLPAPAKAKREGIIPPERAGRYGGNSSVRGKFTKNSSLAMECRAFTGKGVALGEAKSADFDTPKGAEACVNSRRTPSRSRHETEREAIFNEAIEESRISRGSSSCSAGSREHRSAAVVGSRMMFDRARECGWDTTDGTVERRLLGEEKVIAAAVATVSPTGDSVRKDYRHLTMFDEMIECQFCGKKVPAANDCLHELRCSMAKSPRDAAQAIFTAGIAYQLPTSDERELERKKPLSVNGLLISGISPGVGEGENPTSSTVDENHVYPSSGNVDDVDRACSPQENVSATNTSLLSANSSGKISGCSSSIGGVVMSAHVPDTGSDVRRDSQVVVTGSPSTHHNKELAASGEAVGHGFYRRPDVTAIKNGEHDNNNNNSAFLLRQEKSPKTQLVSRIICSYCGLSFKSADAAGSHGALCGTRTERCSVCCEQVLRRDAESHQRPGGGCDRAIAATVVPEEEEEVATAVAASTIITLSDGEYPSGVNFRLGKTMGKFDTLLAEAVSSTKQASIALVGARARNGELKLSLAEKINESCGVRVSRRHGGENNPITGVLLSKSSTGHDVDSRNKTKGTVAIADSRRFSILQNEKGEKRSENRGAAMQKANRPALATSPCSYIGQEKGYGSSRNAGWRETIATGGFFGSVDGGIVTLKNHQKSSKSSAASQPPEPTASDISSQGEQGPQAAYLYRESYENVLIGAAANEWDTSQSSVPICKSGLTFPSLGQGDVSDNTDMLSAAHSSGMLKKYVAGVEEIVDEFSIASVCREWTCSRCTLVNLSSFEACHACGSARGQNGSEREGKDNSDRARVSNGGILPWVPSGISVVPAIGVSIETSAGSEDNVFGAATTTAPAADTGSTSVEENAMILSPTVNRYAPLHTVASFLLESAGHRAHRSGEIINRVMVACPTPSALTATFLDPLAPNSAPQPRRARNTSTPTIDGGSGEFLSPRTGSATSTISPSTGEAGLKGRRRAGFLSSGMVNPVAILSPAVSSGQPPPREMVVGSTLMGNKSHTVLRPRTSGVAATPLFLGSPLLQGNEFGFRDGPDSNSNISTVVRLNPIRQGKDHLSPPPKKNARQLILRRDLNGLRQPSIGIRRHQVREPVDERRQGMAVKIGPRHRLLGERRPPRHRSLPPPISSESDPPVVSVANPVAAVVEIASPSSVSGVFGADVVTSVNNKKSMAGHNQELHRHQQQHQHHHHQRQGQRLHSQASFLSSRHSGQGGYGKEQVIEPGSTNVSSISAPSCELSLSVLGRSHETHCKTPIFRGAGVGKTIASHVKKGSVLSSHGSGPELRDRFPRKRNGRCGRRGGTGVAPAKFQRRVSDSRILEPLNPA